MITFTSPSPSVQLRALSPGDLGWVISRQGALYAQAYGRLWTHSLLLAARAIDQGSGYRLPATAPSKAAAPSLPASAADADGRHRA